jgi:hypothetical protein
MSLVVLACSATQYSLTPNETIVLSGDVTTLKTVTIGWHLDTEQNYGTYAKNTALLRVFRAEFDAIVSAFGDGLSHDISLTYESTLKKNNVRHFTCANVSISFPATTGTSLTANA